MEHRRTDYKGGTLKETRAVRKLYRRVGGGGQVAVDGIRIVARQNFVVGVSECARLNA